MTRFALSANATFIIVVCALTLAACSGQEVLLDDGGDAGDSGMLEDAGPDGGLDAGPDAGIDAGPDAGPDAGIDAGPDAGPPSPQFGTPVITAASSLVSQMASGDLDGDGKLDLVVSLGAPSYNGTGTLIFTGTSIDVLRGNGDGTFQTAVSLTTGTTPHGIALMDVDGDGRLDIVVGVCQSGGDRLSYFLNKGGTGAAQFGPRHDVPVSTCPWSLTVVPGLSGGGRAGLATAGPGPYWLDAGSGAVDTLVADDGGLRIAQSLTTTQVATGVYSADLNADGVPDLAATTSSGRGIGNSLALMWLGSASAGFQPVVPSIRLDQGPYRAIAVGDIDGNGIADLALVSADTATLAVVPGQGNSTYGTVSYQGVSSSPVDLAVADFRKIGTLDIAAATSGYPFVGVSLFPGATAGLIGSEMSVLSDGPASGITAGDFNGDGLPDIAVSLGYLGGVAVIPSLFQPPFLPDPITYQVAAHVPVPPVAYYGGPVLSSPEVITVTFRSDTNTTLYQQFDDWMVGSDWFSTIGADYGVSNGTSSSYVIDEAAPTTLGDPDIQVLLERLILDGGLPPPHVTDGGIAPMQLYMVFFPHGTTISDNYIGTSCQNYGAYHSEDSTFSTPFAYGVMPNCGYGVYYTEISASHELAEASTDPFVRGSVGSPDGPAYTSLSYNNGWVGEIGDVCEPYDTGYVVDGGAYYAVQRIWSNSAVDAGRQPCIPAVDVPYANVSPPSSIPPTCLDPASSEPCTSVYYPATPGTSFELTFTGWTNRPAVPAGVTWAPYYVAGSVMPSFSPDVTLDKYNLRNGDQVRVTVNIPSNAPSQAVGIFTLLSGFDNGNYAYWPVVVVTP
jgi:hypothetical protein